MLRGIVEQPAHLACIKASGASRRRGRAEGTGDAVGSKAALIAEGSTSHRHHDARTDVVAERHCAKQTGAIDAVNFSRCQSRRHHRAARMGAGFIVRVVGFIGMCHHAIGERGIDRCRGHRRCHDGHRAIAAMFADIALRRLARRQFRSRNHCGNGVEQMMFGVFRHVFGQRVRRSRAHVGAERVHHPSRT